MSSPCCSALTQCHSTNLLKLQSGHTAPSPDDLHYTVATSWTKRINGGKGLWYLTKICCTMKTLIDISYDYQIAQCPHTQKTRNSFKHYWRLPSPQFLCFQMQNPMRRSRVPIVNGSPLATAKSGVTSHDAKLKCLSLIQPSLLEQSPIKRIKTTVLRGK